MMNHKVIANAYNIKINYQRSPAECFGWDGTQLNVKGLPEHNILHEIAHYVLSPIEYREYINFYLGYGPDENPVLYNSFMKENFPDKPLYREESQSEEELTCALEFIFAGLYQNISLIKNTMIDRHWVLQTKKGLAWAEDSFNLKEKVKSLQNQNLIDENWIPISLKNKIKDKNLQNLNKFKTMIGNIN